MHDRSGVGGARCSPWASGDGGNEAEDGAGRSSDGDVRSLRRGRTGEDAYEDGAGTETTWRLDDGERAMQG
jgi:hypothetical protein